MIYYTCHQSSVCSSAFSLCSLPCGAPLSLVICSSSVRHISTGARFSHLIGFYHHFRCEVTGVWGVIAEGGSSSRRQLSEEREEEGEEMRNSVSVKFRFVSVLLSSFSCCGTVFSLLSFILFPPPSCRCTLSCVRVCCCCGFVCKCVCTHTVPLGAPISRHVSSVILISSPRGTGELFTHQYFLTLQTVATESASLYCLLVSYWWYWPLLVVLHSLFVSPPISCHPSRTLTTETYHKIPMTFISTLFLTLGFFWCNCADRAQGRLSLFSAARCQTKPLEMDYGGGRGSCSGGGYWRGMEPGWLGCVLT